MERRCARWSPQRSRLLRALTTQRALIIVSFICGISTGVLSMLSLIPRGEIHVPVPLDFEVDITPLIRVRDTAAVEAARASLARFAWGADGIPYDARPVAAGAAASPFDSIAQSVDRLVVHMDSGFVSELLRVRPIEPNGRAVLYHRGHEAATSGVNTIARLVERGFDVITLSMPLFDPNPRPVLQLSGLGPIALDEHALLPLIPFEKGSWLQLFLHPVAAAVNFLQAEGFDDIAMIGLSGGGWTTTIAAATDTRIRRSYPVAGSLPIFLRRETHLGDFEQYSAELLRIANYLDLYVMGSVGPGRSQLQVLNEFDSCCFYGRRHELYEATVADVAAGAGGSFAVFLDETHRSHMISDSAIAVILSDM